MTRSVLVHRTLSLALAGLATVLLLAVLGAPSVLRPKPIAKASSLVLLFAPLATELAQARAATAAAPRREPRLVARSTAPASIATTPVAPTATDPATPAAAPTTPSSEPPAMDREAQTTAASGTAVAASAARLKLDGLVLRAAARRSRSDVALLAEAAGAQLDSPRLTKDERFAAAVADAATPGCLAPDAMKHDPPSIGPFAFGGLLALPFLARTVLTGKCKP